MRPSVTDTPPLSHVMTQKLLPTPILVCGLDWKNLTNDNSIQILDSSEYIQDESVFYNSYVINDVSTANNIVSQYTDEKSFCVDLERTQDGYGHDSSESLTSVNSSTLQNGGIITSRINRNKRVHDSKTIDNTNEKFESIQQFKRARYSDSDIIIRLAGDTPCRQANVVRSKSVGWAESVKQFGDVTLVKPLKPSAYVTKIGDVKRLQSFRSTNKPEICRMSNEPLPEDNHRLNESVSATQENCKPSDNMQAAPFQGPKLKIAKFVKKGLKSVKRSKDFLRKVGQTDQYYEQELKKQRQRGSRYYSGITGLSEFLRGNEVQRRKTLSDIPEVPQRDVTVAKLIETGPKATKNSADFDDSVLEGLNTNSTETPSLIAANGKRKKTGTSNLKFTQCQRKLSFNVEGDALNAVNNEVRETDWISVVNNANVTTRRPRLGIVSSRKHVNLLSIDTLGMDTVLDLKRKLERTARCTRIKTNGSLKPQTKTLRMETIDTQSPIWRKSFRYNRVSGTKPTMMKRESVV